MIFVSLGMSYVCHYLFCRSSYSYLRYACCIHSGQWAYCCSRPMANI